jgi:hypothetical protein|uniref:Uncharacterized protein n=1 Tax=viral metagenome TaxID=1070528 RepID=A0A6C0CVZ7_9ZZZZ
MSQNPFIEFKDDFTNSTPSYFIYEYTYKRLNYELQKCYTPVPMTAEPIIPYDELEERGIPYSREVSYQVKRECDDLFDEAMQELGLINLGEQTVQQEQYPQMVTPPLQEGQDIPYLNEVERERNQEAGKRRPRKSKKYKKSKRKSRKSKKSKKSRKYRKH